MATTVFEWVISQLNCAVESEGLPDVINVIHWRYNATQEHDGKVYFADTYGSSNVAQPNPQNFIPYADVTEAEVIGWLNEILPVDAMQLALENNIALQINPVEVTLPLPWLTTTTTTTTTEAPQTTTSTTEAPQTTTSTTEAPQTTTTTTEAP